MHTDLIKTNIEERKGPIAQIGVLKEITHKYTGHFANSWK